MSARTIDHPGAVMSPLRVWTMAARPKTLPAAVAPVLAGTAVAVNRDDVHWPSAILALVTALLLQVAANFANDALDFRRGADTVERLGPTRITSSGLVTERRVIVATGMALGLAVLSGLPLVIRGGWPILLLGLAAMACAVVYTGGPFPLAYLGLGEVFVFAFFGPVAVAGTAFVQMREWPAPGLLVAVPLGALAVGILVVNNLRDIHTDARANKRTIAVRLGEARTRGEYGVMLGIAVLMPVVLGAGGWLGWWWLLTVAWWPIGWNLWRQVHINTGRSLNGVLAATGRGLLAYSILLSAALVLSRS